MISTRKFSENSSEARLLMLKFGVEYELIPVDFTAEEPRAMQVKRPSNNTERASYKNPKISRT